MIQNALLAAATGLQVVSGSLAALPQAPQRPQAQQQQPALGCDTFCPADVPSVASGLRLEIYPNLERHPIVEAIAAARTSVDVEVYMMTDKEIIDALKTAARRGVQVRVMLEPRPFGGGADVNQKAARALKDAGVQVQWSNPEFRFTHQKSIVIDNQDAWITTANMTRSARLTNREYLVIDSNREDVDELNNIFESDWNRVPYIPGAAAGHLVISPNNARPQVLNLIGKAQKTLSLGFEVIGDDEVQQALIARAQAGVNVQVLIADPGHSSSGDRARRLARELQDGGCEVKFLKKPVHHAKIIVADNLAVYMGSINLTSNSMNNNRELGIIVSQPDVVTGAVKVFASDWAAGDAVGTAQPPAEYPSPPLPTPAPH